MPNFVSSGSRLNEAASASTWRRCRPDSHGCVGYPLLERIHYLLVAGYDVYGNLGHQLTTRMYMDFLRMEGESNFLALLPLASRDGVRDHWYRGAGDDVKQYLQGSKAYFANKTGVRYRTGDPLPELFGRGRPVRLRSLREPVMRVLRSVTMSMREQNDGARTTVGAASSYGPFAL